PPTPSVSPKHVSIIGLNKATNLTCVATGLQIKSVVWFKGSGIFLGQGFLNFVVALGSSIDLECKASIVPGSEISLELSTLYKIITIVSDGKQVIKKGNIFTIHGIDRDKAGDVFCKTTSRCGGQATGYKIGRLVPVVLPNALTPRPTLKPGKQTLYRSELNNGVQYQCLVNPVPVKTFAWFVDGKRIDDKDVQASSDRKHSNLTVTEKYCASSKCSIECRVTSNGAGYWYSTTQLTIKESTIYTIQPPRAQRIDEYKSALVPCPAQFTPIYQSTSKGRTPRYPDGIKIKWTGNSFEIRWFDNNDVGEYYCDVNNMSPMAAFSIRGKNIVSRISRADPEYHGRIQNITGGSRISRADPEYHGRIQNITGGSRISRADPEYHGRIQNITGGSRDFAKRGARSDYIFQICNRLCSLAIGPPMGGVSVKIASPNEITVEFNGGTNLLCYTSSQSSSLVWTKTDLKGSQVTVTGPKTTQSGSRAQSVLELRNVSKLDEGTYTCSLAVGRLVRTASVKVNVKDVSKPIVVANSSKIITKENKHVKMSCVVSSSPGPAVVWFKDGKQLSQCNLFFGSILCSSSIQDYNTSYFNGVYTLTIRNVSHESNDGKYECVATNVAGKARASIVVTVYGKYVHHHHHREHSTSTYNKTYSNNSSGTITITTTTITSNNINNNTITITTTTITSNNNINNSSSTITITTTTITSNNINNNTITITTTTITSNNNINNSSSTITITTTTITSNNNINNNNHHHHKQQQHQQQQQQHHHNHHYNNHLQQHQQQHHHNHHYHNHLQQHQQHQQQQHHHNHHYIKPKLYKQSALIDHVVAKPTKHVHLPCTIQHGNPTPTFTWYQASSSMCNDRDYNCKPQDNQWQKISSSVTDPMISSPRNDTVFYKCTATNAVGQDSVVFSVVRMESPKLVKQGEIASYYAAFTVHRSLVIDILSGNPPPHYRWFTQRADHCITSQGICKPRSKRWIRSNHDVSPPPGTSSLRSVISLPPTARAFFYKVEAVNVVGSDSQVFSVVRIWEQVPEITTPQGQLFDEGDIIQIQCKAKQYDFQALDIQRKDGQPLPTNRTKTVTNIVDNDMMMMTLLIDHVTLDDGGVYGCLGYNENSTSPTAAVNINVTATVPPVVSLSNKTTLSTVEQVSLHCHVISGHPKPKITWYRNGLPIQLKPLGPEGNCSSFVNGFYHLHDFKASHSEYLVVCDPKHELNSGWYTCKAENSKGKASAVSKYLNIHEAPSVRLVPDGSLISIEYGDRLQVTCLAKGNPEPTITWVKKTDDGKEYSVNSKDIRDVKSGTMILVRSVDDTHYGVYACHANNVYGNASISVSVGNPVILQRQQPAPKSHLIAAIIVSVVLLFFLIVFAVILYRRRQMYGGFYLCATPPLPDLIKSLDPTSPLIEQVHKLPYDPVWEYPRGNLVFRDVLGTGAFGKVYLAETESFLVVDDTSSVSSRHRLAKRKDYRRASSSSAKPGTLKVAVKSLKENAIESDHNDLLSELKILIHVGAHKNIVNLLGACTKGPKQDLWVIIEYCQYGDLMHYLKDKRDIHEPTWEPPTDDPKVQFSLTELVSATYQVARGMEFLTSRRLVVWHSHVGNFYPGHTLMKECWMHGPDDRPTFKDLVIALDKAIECNAMGREAYLELDNLENLKDENYNKDIDGYLQPSDIMPLHKTSQENTPCIDEPHLYSEIPDISTPVTNGDIKTKDFNDMEEKESLLKKPCEYEMAMKCPRYVNFSDADNSTTTML
ncbi:hypothetical protein QZH41_017156, partial [Actinostola sp. cb2023]